MNLEKWIDGIEEETYYLATRADCGSPDAVDSPGMLMLIEVRDAIIDAVRDGRIVPDVDQVGDADRHDVIHSIADGAVSIYTHAKWKQFVDLCAYQEDLDELGGSTGNLDKDADCALFLIAERLGAALCEDLDEWAQDQQEEEEG